MNLKAKPGTMKTKTEHCSVCWNVKRAERSVYVSTQSLPTPLVSCRDAFILRAVVFGPESHAVERNAVRRLLGRNGALNRSTARVLESLVCVRRENHFGGAA